MAHLDVQAILERRFRRGTIFSLTKKRRVPKNEVQMTKLAEGTGLTEKLLFYGELHFALRKW